MDTLQFGKMIDKASCISRPGVYAVIINDKNEVALVKAKGDHHLPGGGIHKGEKPNAALNREIREEVGFAFEGQKKSGGPISTAIHLKMEHGNRMKDDKGER